MNCAEANELSLLYYLSFLGYQPQKVRGEDHWYLSPLREEREPSFKVNSRKNVWYDHGTGKGGTLVDFGTLYHACPIAHFLQKLSLFSFHPHPPLLIKGGISERAKKGTESDKRVAEITEKTPIHRHTYIGKEKKESAPEPALIVIAAKSPVTDPRLCRYAATRKIPENILNRYCKEVFFSLNERKFTAIGFQNREGGWELRNERFQASSSPKAITLLNNGNDSSIKVFEGFFDFLSYQTLLKQGKLPQEERTNESDYLILNSLSFFQKSLPLLEKREQIDLYLDRDAAGRKCIKEALKRPDHFLDRSTLYRGFKDLSEWHQKTDGRRLMKRDRGRHL